MKPHSQLLDLNSAPAEGVGEGSLPSGSMPVSHSQASSSMPPAANGLHIGMHSFPIDVEAIDDDVVIYPSRSLPHVCALCLVLVSNLFTTFSFILLFEKEY